MRVYKLESILILSEILVIMTEYIDNCQIVRMITVINKYK
jgi:hypothetical protein